jgi:hypothetical protein
MNLTELRQEIADSLNSLVANVYFYPPATIITPAVIVVPDSGIYIEPISIGAGKYRVRYRLTIAVQIRDNQSALENIETLIFGVYESLPSGYVVLDATSPNIVNLGQSDLLTSEIAVEKIVTAS